MNGCAGTHNNHVLGVGKMRVCQCKLLFSLIASMLITCLFKAQMSSDTAGSLCAVVNWSESLQSRRIGPLTNRDRCVQIPHDQSLDSPGWDFCAVFHF